MNFDSSLFWAYCEYVFSKPKPAAKTFGDVQLGHLRKTISFILTLEAIQGHVEESNIPELVDHVIVTIDGLSVMVLGGAATDKIVSGQLKLLE